MWKRLLLVGAARIAAATLIIIACLWPLTIFFSYGREPCTDDSSLQIVSRIILPFAFAVAAWLLFRAASTSSWRAAGTSCTIVFVALLATWLASKHNDTIQKACSVRSWPEAVRDCQANPKHYRRSIGTTGYPIYTLIPPGITDDAWNCLMRWHHHNGSVSMEVDESVYEAYRRSLSKK